MHEIVDNEINIKYRDGQDYAIYYEIFVDHEYSFLNNLNFNKWDLVIDVWAHIWLFSIYLNSIKKWLNYIMYEPFLENFEILKENIKNNWIKWKLINKCVFRETWNTQLFLSKKNQNHSLIQWIFCKDDLPILVKSIWINEILNWKITLLKMDVEGAEFDIIWSIDKEKFKLIKYIMIEYHEFLWNTKDDIISLLEENSFKVLNIKESIFSKNFWLLFFENKNI